MQEMQEINNNKSGVLPVRKENDQEYELSSVHRAFIECREASLKIQL